MDFKQLQFKSFLIILFSATALFAWLLKDYVMPVFWAITLAVVFYPINERLVKYFSGKRALASSVSLILLVFAILIPVFLFSLLFIKEAANLYYSYDSASILNGGVGAIDSFLSGVGIDSSAGDISLALNENLKSYTSQIGNFALGVGKGGINFAIKFAIMIYILFFLFKDGNAWYAKIIHILPLGDRKEKYLFKQFASMVRAVFKGSFIIAIVQGLLGMLLFAFVGIPSPVVWGALMMLLAFIPAVGPALVWAPAGVILWITGDVMSAIVVFAVGVLVISMIDNILRPILMGKDTALPDLLIFLSVLGGLSTFGMAGIIIGPVIATLFVAVWELFEKDFHDELGKWG